MFHHDGRLEHVLAPRDYSSSEFFDHEQERVFARSWHFVALESELSEPGSRVATDVGGVPVVVWNVGGELRAFRNVCLHRHTRIVPEGSGRGERLRCQYHGWEYGDDGRIAKIPDGRSFKGLRSKDWCLTSYRISRLGSLIFVNVDPEAEDLRDALGAQTEEMDYFYGDHTPIWRWVMEFPVNWKIIVENAVESYHVPMLHPTTFRDYKDEAHHDHVLHPAFTSYLDTAPMGTSVIERGFRLYTQLVTPTVRFERAKHVHVFPNHLFEVREVYSLFSTVLPVAPERTRFMSYGFLPRRMRVPVVGGLLKRLFGIQLARMAKKIMGEDIGIWSEAQHGLNHSETDGVLSSREERVFAFQRHVADRVTGTTRAQSTEEPARVEGR